MLALLVSALDLTLWLGGLWFARALWARHRRWAWFWLIVAIIAGIINLWAVTSGLNRVYGG